MFNEAEKKAIQIATDFAPHVPPHVIEGIVLSLRSESLALQTEGLLAALERMHPKVASRALRQQGQRSEELANDLQDHVSGKRHES